MSWSKTKNVARLNTAVWNVAALVVLTMLSAFPRSGAQAMQKGISVELALTSSAVPVPAADNQDALITTVTETGKLYLGIDPVTPESLGEKLKGRLSQRTQSLYIKADARAPYASVVKVFDAAHAAGVSNITLLTTQARSTQPGKVVVPEGIEMGLARRASATTE